MTAQQPSLFDPRTTEKPKCTSCGATVKNLCRHDADLEHGLISRTRKRPRGCLAAVDPKTMPIPF